MLWKQLDRLLGKIIDWVISQILKKPKLLKKLAMTLLIIILSITISFGCIFIIMKLQKYYPSIQLEKKQNEIYTKMKSFSNSCHTQNCVGVLKFHNGVYVKFKKIYCRDDDNSIVRDITQEGMAESNFYHINNQYQINKDNKDIATLIKHQIWGIGDFLGIVPEPQIKDDVCNEWRMKLLLSKEQTKFNISTKMYEDNLLEADYQISFFTNTIFPNLNTKCNPQYDSVYKSSSYKELWFYNAYPFVIWGSFAELDKCDQARNRASIKGKLENFGKEFAENYDNMHLEF